MEKAGMPHAEDLRGTCLAGVKKTDQQESPMPLRLPALPNPVRRKASSKSLHHFGRTRSTRCNVALEPARGNLPERDRY